jgi:hypothetical protein
MPSKSRRPRVSMKAQKKKTNYAGTARAIEKKLVEIKRESSSQGAVNNNLALFRYML